MDRIGTLIDLLHSVVRVFHTASVRDPIVGKPPGLRFFLQDAFGTTGFHPHKEKREARRAFSPS